MTVRVTHPEAAAEVEERAALLARATVAYIARLNDIADISTLTAGSHDFTYAITVPQDEKLALLSRLADLTMDIEDEFGVKITTLAVAGPPRALKPDDPAPKSGTIKTSRKKGNVALRVFPANEPSPSRTVTAVVLSDEPRGASRKK